MSDELNTVYYVTKQVANSLKNSGELISVLVHELIGDNPKVINTWNYTTPRILNPHYYIGKDIRVILIMEHTERTMQHLPRRVQVYVVKFPLLLADVMLL